MAQQKPPQSGRMPARGSRHYWQDEELPDDDEYPPWAGPGIIPRYADHGERERRRLGRAARDGDTGRGPGGTRQRGEDGGRRSRMPGGRAATARIRRARRYIWRGAALLVVVIVAGVAADLLLVRQSAPQTPADSLVTTFQAGEFQTVPNACAVVTKATLDRYLPGNRSKVAPHSLFGSEQSLCDWSVDAQSMYWVLQVSVRAYEPSGIPAGDGSASSAAAAGYLQARKQRTDPALLKASHLPKAVVTPVRQLGEKAFAALQKPSAGGAATEMMTVVARERNVLVTVVFEVTRNGGKVPVSRAKLQAGGVAAAREILAGLH